MEGKKEKGTKRGNRNRAIRQRRRAGGWKR